MREILSYFSSNESRKALKLTKGELRASFTKMKSCFPVTIIIIYYNDLINQGHNKFIPLIKVTYGKETYTY